MENPYCSCKAPVVRRGRQPAVFSSHALKGQSTLSTLPACYCLQAISLVGPSRCTRRDDATLSSVSTLPSCRHVSQANDVLRLAARAAAEEKAEEERKRAARLASVSVPCVSGVSGVSFHRLLPFLSIVCWRFWFHCSQPRARSCSSSRFALAMPDEFRQLQGSPDLALVLLNPI